MAIFTNMIKMLSVTKLQEYVHSVPTTTKSSAIGSYTMEYCNVIQKMKIAKTHQLQKLVP